MNWSKKYKTEQWYKKQEEKNKQLKEEMAEKIKADKEFFRNLSPKKQKEYKLSKIFITVFIIVFFLAAIYGYRHAMLLPILITEVVITVISIFLWKAKKNNIYMMPLIAFVLTLLGLGGFFLRDALEKKVLIQQLEAETKKSIKSEKKIEALEELDEIDYELWLKQNNIIRGDD